MDPINRRRRWLRQGLASVPAAPPSTYDVWNAAVDRVAGATGRGIVLCVGDSTTRGVKGGDSGGDNNSYGFAYPKVLSDKLTTAGIASMADAWVGNGNVTVFADAKFAGGSNWVLVGDVTSPSIGGFGRMWTSSGGGTGVIAYTPTNAQDRIRLILYGTADFVMSAETNGGANLQSINFSIANGSVQSFTISVPLGSYTHTFRRVSGSPAILAIDAFDTTTPRIQVMNLGIGSVQTLGYNASAQPYNPVHSLPLLTPDLVLIDLGINDRAALNSVSTYKNNLKAITQYCLATGADVMLKDYVPTNPSLLTPEKIALDAAYSVARQQIATQFGLHVITNVGGIGETYNGSNYNADGIHPNQTGYGLVATKCDVDVRSFIV